MKTPLISVILPTYNGSKYISEAIESVLDQSFSDFEFIIINDASTDNKVENIILEFQKKDPRIIYIKNEQNLKLTRTLNKWIDLSKWDYIARIDDDDIWTDKDKLKKQFSFLNENLEYWIIWTNWICIDKNDNIIWKIIHSEQNDDIRKKMLFTNQFIHSSVLIRKNIINKVWSYNPEWNYVEDYEFWLRIWNKSKLYNLSDFSIHYRILENSITRQKNFRQNLMILKLLFKNRNSYPNFISSLFLRLIILIFPQKFISSLKNYFNLS